MADPNNLIHGLRPRPPGHLRKTLLFGWDRKHAALGEILTAIHGMLRPDVPLGTLEQAVRTHFEAAD